MIAALAALAAAVALAGEVRVGVFVGNDEGDVGQERLLFATSDARKMRDLFVGAGGVAPDDAFLVLDGQRRDVAEALRLARLRLERAEAAGDSTMLVFFYSGHGDETGLKLGTTQLFHDDLRAFLDLSGADVRIAVLDACQSGAAVRQKGGVRGPSHAFAVDVDRAQGTAFLTSSAASEFSQESEEIGGGFFTYYLHSALAGAGDADGDGDVSLAEAYAFVHTETAFRTRTTPEQQTPTFDLDLTGSGDLWLTRLDAASASLSFPGGLSGTYAVWDEGRRRYVAEVDGAAVARVAVPPGTYYVQRRLPGFVEQARYDVGRSQARDVRSADFVAVAYEDTASRGDLAREARRAKMPDLQLFAQFGGRGFGQTVAGSQYLPNHAVAGLGVRSLGRTGPYVGFDLLSGGGPGTLAFSDVGPVDVDVQSASVGGAAGFATRPGVVRAGIGGRAEIVWFRRSFPDGELPTQDLARPSVGAQAWAGVHYGRVHADLTWNLEVLAATLDDRANLPVYGEILISMGYRF